MLSWFKSKPRCRKNYNRSVEALEPRELLAVLTVTNSLDAGRGSLRQAILDANTTPVLDTVVFNVTGEVNSRGLHHVHLTSPLPVASYPVVIDARTQPGYSGSPLFEIHGKVAGPCSGLQLKGDNSALYGMSVWEFKDGAGIWLGGQNQTVEECLIWENDDGIRARRVSGAAIRNNEIFGNWYAGVHFIGAEGGGHRVTGNNFHDNQFSVVVYNSPNNTVSDNTMDGGYRGVSVSGGGAIGNDVSANNISGMDHYAVFVAVGASNSNVNGNNISGCWGGIVLTGSAVNDNWITNNHITGAVKPLIDDGGTGNVWAGNLID